MKSTSNWIQKYSSWILIKQKEKKKKKKKWGMRFEVQLQEYIWSRQSHFVDCIKGKCNDWLDGWKYYFKGRQIIKIYKTLLRLHIEYCTQVRAPVWRQGNWSGILRLEGIQKRVTIPIKREKNYSYRDRLEELWLSTLLKRKKIEII